MEAFAINLLRQLFSSLMLVERVVTAEQRKELRESRRKMELSLNALEELGRCTDRASADVDVSPTSRKKPKALARHSKLDPYPLDCMGLAVPTTEREVRVAYGDTLLRLQVVFGVRIFLSLQFTLKLLHGPRIAYSSSGDPRYQVCSSVNSKSQGSQRPSL